MSPPLNLIQNALNYARQELEEFEEKDLGISEPLTPRAQRHHQYLRIRENILKGCRKSVKAIPENWKRSVAYSVLVEACMDIFHYKKSVEIMATYNNLLDTLIGTH